MAATPGGQLAVSYYSVNNKALGYSVWNGSTWSTQTVESNAQSGLDTGRFTSLAFSPSGRPASSYYDATNKNLKFAAWNGTNWGRMVVEKGVTPGDSTKLAFSSSGQPFIVYYDSAKKQLRFVTQKDGIWTASTIVSMDDYRCVSLAVTPAGLPAVAYFDFFEAAIRYAVLKPYGTP